MTRNICRNKEECFIIKESMYQENKTIINEYMPNNKASKFMNQKLTELKEKKR